MARKNNGSKSFKRLMIGTGIAAAAGYVAGLLTAPKSGKQTRKELQKATNAGLKSAEQDLKKLHTELGDMLNDSKKAGNDLNKKAQSELNDVVNSAKDAKEKVRELISAIHEGGADDKDLKKAIKDARAAVEHLRDYLKK